MKPEISVCMPFYDNGNLDNRKYFSEAIDSILNQSYKNYEIVVAVSGHSEFALNLTKKSKKIRVFHFSQEITDKMDVNKRLNGIVAARNLCLKKAKGRFIAWADSDDVSSPDRLRIQHEFLVENPGIGAVGSSMRIRHAWKRTTTLATPAEYDCDIRKNAMRHIPLHQPTVFIRKNILKKVGGYNADEFCEDYYLWIRLLQVTKFHNIQRPLVYYRMINNKTFAIRLQAFQSYMRIKIYCMYSLKIKPGAEDLLATILHFVSVFFPRMDEYRGYQKVKEIFRHHFPLPKSTRLL